MSQKIYRHVLRDAWSVTWRHPALWIFGALALFMGQSQFFYSLGGLFKITSLTTGAAELAATSREWFLPVVSPNSWAQVIIGVLVAIGIVSLLGVLVFLTVQAQGAIMSAGDYIFRKRLYSFSGAWHTALDHFWSIVGILLVKIFTSVITAIILFVSQDVVTRWPDVWWPKVVFILGFALAAVIDIFITFSALYATCYVVLERQRMMPALRNAVGLFKRHWLASLEIGVIFLITNVVLALIMRFAYAILFVPLLYVTVLMRAATGLTEPFVYINLAILFGALWVIAAIYTTWFYMSIVTLFDHMQTDTPVSKVMRFLRRVVGKRQ